MSKELDSVWKALSDPTRRAILDLLRRGPRTTTEIVEAFPHLTRFGVMKHIDVLRNASLIHTREQGRQRVNSLNAVPIRQIYERWVSPYQDLWADSLLRLKEDLEITTGKEGGTMPMIDGMLMEMEQEAHATRRLLERVPEDKMSWKPHAKSYSLGQLALHVAQVPGVVTDLAVQDVVESPQFQQAEAKSGQELLETFEKGLAKAKDSLSKLDDQKLMATWTLQKDGKTLMAVPRVGILRTILLNHYYHHRGQLTVYLRLLDVPLPSVYGPTADENPFAQ